MDRRSWLWRRKSSEKSPGETESSGSVSSHSERYSDDQEALRASPINYSPNHAQSEVSSNVVSNEVNETVKSLTEKLSTALLNISAKEDLVKQHSKVAEEAVSGWEKAENELAALKQQLEATAQRNSALEDRISHLDGALMECVRQLRQSREEQEEKIHDAIIKKTREWESEKVQLDNQLVELKTRLEAAQAETVTSIDNGLKSKLEATEKENAALKDELLTRSKELEMRILERELCTQTAETASKQHLESIKKVAKLEAECRRLRALARRVSSANDHKIVSSSVCVESLSDSMSDSRDGALGVDIEPSCSDSWASALIAELDQFKNDKSGAKNVAVTSTDIDLMDDFLEMERLAALPEDGHESSSVGLEADSEQVAARYGPSNAEFDIINRRVVELEEKVEEMETEKAQLNVTLADRQNQLEASCYQLSVASDNLVEMQKQLDSVNEAKQFAVIEVESAEAKRKTVESQLEAAQLELRKLHDMVALLDAKVKESAVASEIKLKLEASEAKRQLLETDLRLSHLQVDKLQGKLGLLEGKLEEERVLSAKLLAKAEAMESERMSLESQLLLTDSEVRKLQGKVDLLEQRLVEERLLSTEFSAKVKAVEAERKALKFQLESEHSEVEKLNDKVGSLERKADDERALSAQFEAKCRNLENELSRTRRDAELRSLSSSNGELKIKQEKELAVAAGKLAECQKTIASLGRQLKLLTTFDDFSLEPEMTELNGDSTDFRIGDAKMLHSNDSSEDTRSPVLLNGQERGSKLGLGIFH